MKTCYPLLALSVLALGSCAQVFPESDKKAVHIFPVDSDSLFYPYPRLKKSPWNLEKSESYLKERIIELDNEYARTRPREIILFLHGGLAMERAGIAGAARSFDRIRKASGDKTMPIFVTWDSGFFSSYGRHLGGDGNGVSYFGTAGGYARSAAYALLNFPTDIATGVVKTPKTLVDGFVKASQGTELIYQAIPGSYPTKSAYVKTVREVFGGSVEHGFYRPAGSVAGVPWAVSIASGPAKFDVLKTATAVAWSPVTVGLAPAYQGLGRPAWENMTRRSHTLVHRYPTLIASNGSERDPRNTADGVMATVMRQIAKWQEEDPSLKVTLVGHSMGTMVLNEVFRGMQPTASSRERGKGAIPHVAVERIVYLAAACSIRDFNDSAGHYLARNPTSKCYNLCLHPTREVKEENLDARFRLVLAGSLLTWIDEFFESPRDFQDRTFGSFENCIVAYQHMPNTSRFFLKAFGDDAGWKGEPKSSQSGPQKHGQFSGTPYWDDSFLEPCDPAMDVSYR